MSLTPVQTVGLIGAGLAGVALVAFVGTSRITGAADQGIRAVAQKSASGTVLPTIKPDWTVADQAAAVDEHGGGSMQGAVARLERRLASEGGSDADWDLLARSYEFLGRASDAAQARNKHVPADAATGNPSAVADAVAPADRKVSVDGEVILSRELEAKVPPGLTLFIVAKSVNSPGPPVAILRTTTDAWPVRFRLDDTQAMLPQRKLSTAGPVTIEARTSKSGQAMPERGDFLGATTQLDPASGKPVRIVIERVIG
jgi:hypothetical protein